MSVRLFSAGIMCEMSFLKRVLSHAHLQYSRILQNTPVIMLKLVENLVNFALEPFICSFKPMTMHDMHSLKT